MIKDTGDRLLVFPLENPGLISIPLAFLLGYIGTWCRSASRRRTPSPRRWRSGR